MILSLKVVRYWGYIQKVLVMSHVTFHPINTPVTPALKYIFLVLLIYLRFITAFGSQFSFHCIFSDEAQKRS